MKKLLIVGFIVSLGALLFIIQHHRRVVIQKQHAQLESMAVTLQRRIEENARRQTAAEEERKKLEAQFDAQQTARQAAAGKEVELAAAIPPDPSHQGGWPKGADYFYLPKTFLQQASFPLISGERLSEETAQLYNLSESERVEIDQAVGDLFAQLRTAESERMKLVDPPREWGGGFEWALAYHIPSLSEDIASWRETLQDRLNTTLGPERGQSLNGGIDDYLRQEWNDLGAGERTVGFVWRTEGSGNESMWYAIRDERHGAGNFRRYLPGADADSAIRHYANLFGVELPKP